MEAKDNKTPNFHKPAYPVMTSNGTHVGLTKRELIAAMAMQGLLTSGYNASAAIDAVEFADALLSKLNKI